MTVDKLDWTTVRVTSNDDRLGAFDVTLTRPMKDQIIGAPSDPVSIMFGSKPFLGWN